jgi:hypothetical protein
MSNPVHKLIPYLFQIYFNIILLFTPGPSKWYAFSFIVSILYVFLIYRVHLPFSTIFSFIFFFWALQSINVPRPLLRLLASGSHLVTFISFIRFRPVEIAKSFSTNKAFYRVRMSILHITRSPFLSASSITWPASGYNCRHSSRNPMSRTVLPHQYVNVGLSAGASFVQFTLMLGNDYKLPCLPPVWNYRLLNN